VCAFCVQYILLGESLGVPVDKLNLVVVCARRRSFVRGRRAGIAWTEALTLLTKGVSDEVFAEVTRNFPRRNWPI